MKQLAILIVILSLVSASCQPASNLQTPAVPTSSPRPAPSDLPSTPTSARTTDISGRLEELGGKPCDSVDGFICVTVAVPLDHSDPTRSETIDVVFAVAPATGERKGMLIWATGGPGGEGISRASRDYFSAEVQNQYDLVFFDQRGLGRSHALECKSAYADYFLQYLNENDNTGEEGYDTPEEQQAALQSAKAFVDTCIAEIGIDPEKLQFFITDQVAQDIESFRQVIGDDKFMLYGISYGTSVAQAYARAYPDHLSGLILDGTLDTTLSGNEMSVSQWEAMNMVLQEVFKACDADPECSALVGGDSQAAYDQLAERLADGPIPYTESFPAGKKVEHLLTLHKLDYTALYQLYGIESRLELMRVLASANAGDLKPLMRLFYGVTLVNPATGEYKGDPDFSDTMFFVVWCSDDAYYSGTSEERAAMLMQELQNRNGLIPRIDNFPIVELTCPYWPSAPGSPEHREPLKAPGVPTFVLNATLDPATPFHEGKTVFEHLDHGYHLYVEGGRHGSYRRGRSCPDQYIEDFLVKGILPEQREIVCDWGNAVLGQ